MNITYKLLAAFAFVAFNTAQAGDRPNFLLMIADDLTWSDLGYEGNRDVQTPNLDKLCSEGMHLRGMFTPAREMSEKLRLFSYRGQPLAKSLNLSADTAGQHSRRATAGGRPRGRIKAGHSARRLDAG